ncbi:MAG: glutathione binding-like protein [Gammaproteobacteria bacterium]
MLDYYFWTTPNGYKALLFLEETGLEYRIRPVNISKGEQFEPDYLTISPNNKIPALVDHDPVASVTPVSLFESGAILLYLAEKTGRFLPVDIHGRTEVLQWLFWQVGGVGPMFGQNLHFGQYAPERIKYANTRYLNETARLLSVLNKRLANRRFIAGDYSIADMATYPWAYKYPHLQIDLDDYPHVRRWFDTVSDRPATLSAYTKGAEINTVPTITEESKKLLLGQTAEVVSQ